MTQNSNSTSIFDDIREQTAFVMACAKDVRVNDDKIASYTQEILEQYPAMPEMSEDWHLIDRDNPDRTALYVLILDSINFGSGYFAAIKPHNGQEGYALVAACLKQAFTDRGWDQLSALSGITAQDCADVFHQDISDPDVRELMELFVWSINITLQHLQQGYDGTVLSLLDRTGKTAKGLVEVVSKWENFADFAEYQGKRIPFLKRAQILAADLHLAFDETLFDDMDQVTIFADNQVPHVLYMDGILSYSDDLARKIEQGHMFTQGEPQEMELRAAAIVAVEKMVLAARASDKSAFWFDQVLWHRGLEAAYTLKQPHRAKTIFY